jgi:hypothetical protein
MRPIEVKIASERAEWEEAFRIVLASYQARGYEPPTATGLRFTPYHALPDTTTFVAKHEGHVIATLSQVMDNPLLGLPMESIYGPELDELRRRGRRLSEVTSLADTGLSPREFFPVFVTLMRLLAQYLVTRGCDAMVITINPRHRAFYRKIMGFVPFGPCRAYPAVRNHPAEGYLLNIRLLAENAPRMYQQIFGVRLPPEVLTAQPMPPHLIRYFAIHSCQTDLETVNALLEAVERPAAGRWAK